MTKVLCFPLLNSMPSGHHQVAEAIMEYISNHSNHIECKKVDILSEWNPAIEEAIVKIYKSWIHHAPALYGSLYRLLAKSSKSSRTHKLYEILLMKKMEEVLAKEEPDLIVCTHALPSYLLNQLKKKGKCSTPCLNVYTDFFINNVWGVSNIEYHFVPSRQLKEQLIIEHNIAENRVFITGIPVSTYIKKDNENKSGKREFNLLFFAGGLKAKKLVDELKTADKKNNWNLQILNSPTNKALKKMSNQKFSNVQLLPDIASKEKMNELYSQATAFVTKPGGTLISEAMKKEVPIFVHMTLPGQEEINLRYLIEQKLVYKIPENSNTVNFVVNKAEDPIEMETYNQNFRNYVKTIELRNPQAVYKTIEQFLS